MSDFTGKLFVFLVVFWTILTIFSNYFMIELGTIEDYEQGNIEIEEDKSIVTLFWEKAIGGLFDTIDNLPILNVFSPILKIMSFSYTDKVPYAISLILNVVGIITGYVIFKMVRGD